MSARPLPAIPLIDAGSAWIAPVVDAARDRFDDLLQRGRTHYGERALRIGDRLSLRWLDRTANPYRADIRDGVARAGMPGLAMLNLSFEWSCTAGVGPSPTGGGNRLLRTLDWPLPGLGCDLVVARRQAAAGGFLDATWPGFAGVLTAMAPGRFSAAINQPPMAKVTSSYPLDWALARAGVWRRRGLPPAHLLRRVFETCRSYAEARTMLTEQAICMPVFFSLSGVQRDEGCVIERSLSGARVHDSPAAIANHWIDLRARVFSRGADSESRLAAMVACHAGAGDDFAWVAPPLLNPTTRLAAIADAARGMFMLRGYESETAVTADFTHLGAAGQTTGSISPSA